MEFTIQRDDLYSVLQKVQSVVEKKNTVQILANILCTVEDDTLSLSATDLEVGIKVQVPVEKSESGQVTIAAKQFYDIIKELPSRPVRVHKKPNDWVEITSGKARFNVVSLSADEYPSLPSFEEQKYSDAKVPALLEMINKTSFAVSNDATRYHLTGVYLEKVDQNLMRMTATDGHRLSYMDCEVFLDTPDFKRGIVIPKKGLNELKKLLEQLEDTVGIAFERGYFFVSAPNTYLFVRLIDGEYPDYRQVIPKETTRTALMSRDEFAAALRRVSLFAHEKSRSVKMTFKDNLLNIVSSNPDLGEAVEEIDCEYDGDEIEIGFNAKYFLDCLAVIASEKIEIKLKERLNPAILQSVDQRNHNYIVMPMRV